jgi:hypothetical protein
MIKIKIDFKPDAIMKAVVEAAADDIKTRLRRGGVHGATVKVKKKGRNDFSFDITGDEDQVEKAMKILEK